MNAIVTFCPNAKSPLSIAGPSAKIVPLTTWSPTLTIGLWLIDVPALLRTKFCKRYWWSPSPFVTTTRRESTYETKPSSLATTAEPESRAIKCSKPVPTNGACGFNKGKAWRCMFAPIKARVVSSFSKNGIHAEAIETICFGETSI